MRRLSGGALLTIRIAMRIDADAVALQPVDARALSLTYLNVDPGAKQSVCEAQAAGACADDQV
jgi:hypothetical protein